MILCNLFVFFLKKTYCASVWKFGIIQKRAVVPECYICRHGYICIVYRLRCAAKKTIEKGMSVMRFIITGRNIVVTDALRTAVEEKLGKLDKFFASETEVHVTLGVQRERQKIEVTIPVKGHIIRSEQVSDDMYVSIDLVEEVIERQLKKYKNKIIDKKQNSADFSQEFVEEEYDEEEEVTNEGGIEIIRTKHFGIKPMYPEDACVQMELLGHNFYVFLNAETDQVNVVYKRKGNTYGLIEPEME